MPDIAKFPTQGKYYKLKKGDFLNIVAGRAYGDRKKWPLIFNSSRTKLKSGNPDLPFIGELVFIPFLRIQREQDPSQCDIILQDRDREKMTLILEDREIPITAGRIIRTMDTAASAWTATIAWIPGADPKLDLVVKPYGYPQAGIYIGNDLMICGKVYGVTPRRETNGISKDLEGFSSTIDIVDSMMKPPYQRSNVDLLQRCTELMERFGLTVNVPPEGTDTGGKFKRVTAKKDETIFEHLRSLARQRGVLISDTRSGNLLLTRTNVNSDIVDTLVEDEDFIIANTSKFDGRLRWASYKAISQGSRKKKKKVAVANDPEVPGARFLTFNANDSTAGEIKKAAIWEKNKALADSLTINLTISSWYTKKDELWEENTLVFVKSPTLDLVFGFTFLIKQVEYVHGSEGNTATLSLVPPGVYTGEDFVDPWTITA